MSLPEITELEIEDDSPELSSTVHVTYDWDFEAGDFRLKDGATVELVGVDYLKLWIQKTLRTVKDSNLYEGTDYGSEHESLIGTTFNPAFTQSEYERMIQEALLLNVAITRVDNFNFLQSGERLTIGFDVQSIYGATGEAVTI